MLGNSRARLSIAGMAFNIMGGCRIRLRARLPSWALKVFQISHWNTS